LPGVGEVYGPTFQSCEAEGAGIRIRFEHADGLKSSDGKPLREFAVAGADKRFRWADARVEGATVLVSAREVGQPVAVRYAWSEAPHGNLVNAAGLPAAPFRSDDFKPPTYGNR
jgi:sialate O-acetylesterase